MSYPARSLHTLMLAAAALAPRAIYLVAAAALCALTAHFVEGAIAGILLLSVGGTLTAMAILLVLLRSLHSQSRAHLGTQLAAFIELDASPSFATDENGEITFQNPAADERFGAHGNQTLTRALGDVFASPAAMLHRLQNRAEAVGAAREDLVTRRGHVRLSVHRVAEACLLWRLEDMVEKAAGGRGAGGISLPMLTVSGSGTILFMNDALRRLIGERVRTLDKIIADLPLRPGAVHQIHSIDGPRRATVAAIDGNGGRSEVFFLPAADENTAIMQTPSEFDTLPVALMKVSERGGILEINRAARDLLGPAFGKGSLSEILEGLGRPVNDWLDDVCSGRAEPKPEVLRLRRSDEDVFLQVTLNRTVDSRGPGLMAVLTDATQLKTLEAQFVQSQKMQAIGQLAGGVAHDFNNLLTAISGHCDLLLLRHDRNDMDYADLVQINQNANRAASLVGQLLAFSRKQTLKPRIIDLRDTLSDLTHLLNRLVGEKVSLTLSHAPDLRHIRADKRQLEQVIMNLVVNARDAMPQGGRISIETENKLLASDLVRDRATVNRGDYVVVRVSDEGSGIAPDKLHKIFEPFFTTKRQGEGTGLGLSTAYGIVKQTGGFIFCDSAFGSGTTFTLYFPAHDLSEEVEAEPAAPAPPRRVTRGGEGVVLLVEDEAPVRAFASRALRMRGYTVIEAESAEEALSKLEDRSLAVDVFVTDVIMPGMDGPSWVREALKVRPNTRVVFVSGYAEESFTEKRERIPNSVFLPKPFSLSELTVTVQNQIH